VEFPPLHGCRRDILSAPGSPPEAAPRGAGRIPNATRYGRGALTLLVDTPTWLDLASRHDGHHWIAALHRLMEDQQLRLLVPRPVLENLEHRRPAPDGQAQPPPLPEAPASGNLEGILTLLHAGQPLEPAGGEHAPMDPADPASQAPSPGPGHDIAKAVLLELYLGATALADLEEHPHALVTGTPADPAPAFARSGSVQVHGIEGLATVLRQHFGETWPTGPAEPDGAAPLRPPAQIREWEQEISDRIWYQQTVNHAYKISNARELADFMDAAKPAMQRMEAAYGQSLGPYSDYEWGMLHGKLSALRWVMGAEKDSPCT
jgi:hypothetical protein